MNPEGTTHTWALMRSSRIIFCYWLLMCPLLLLAAERPIDTANSTITIHVGKAGLFSAAGHEHEVSAPIEQGAIDDSGAGRVSFVVKSARLTVQPESDQAKVQSTMQSDVLQSANYPEIKFESTSVRSIGSGIWSVSGNLALHGATKPVTVEVRKANGAYTGETRIKQTDFGIEPVKVAGGAVRVKDELKIEFVIRTK
jgi:polyisoprenoid-binding protein YceI